MFIFFNSTNKAIAGKQLMCTLRKVWAVQNCVGQLEIKVYLPYLASASKVNVEPCYYPQKVNNENSPCKFLPVLKRGSQGADCPIDRLDIFWIFLYRFSRSWQSKRQAGRLLDFFSEGSQGAGCPKDRLDISWSFLCVKVHWPLCDNPDPS